MTRLATRGAPTRVWVWALWLVLSAASLSGFAAIAFASPLLFHGADWAMLFLELRVMPMIGVAALVSPFVGLIALLLRKWRREILIVIAFCAIAQFAYFGFVHDLAAQPSSVEGAFPEELGF
jgi:hypothetical protein